MFKLIKILSEIKIVPKITKDLARNLWYKVVRDPRWISRDESYMVNYDKFLHNQTLKNIERISKGLSKVDFADNPWDQIDRLPEDQLKEWYIELSKLVNQDKINEIKITPKATVQNVIDLDKKIWAMDDFKKQSDTTDVYYDFGFHDYQDFPSFIKWLESLSQSQLNLLYHELLKLK